MTISRLAIRGSFRSGAKAARGPDDGALVARADRPADTGVLEDMHA